HYAVVSQVQDIDVEVPLVTGPLAFDDLRFTDGDVILMRTDLPPGHLRTTNPQAGNFMARIPLPIGVDVLRGWCSVDVQVHGRLECRSSHGPWVDMGTRRIPGESEPRFHLSPGPRPVSRRRL